MAPGETRGVALHRVDYLAWAADPEYPRALAAFAAFDPARLEGRAERLAFWINAYNLLAIHVVIDRQVTGSIREAGSLLRSVWKRDAGTVGGRPVTLHRIEHEILRPMGDPRIHMAIVCASVSCPDLRREAYRAEWLDAQLDDQARRFLANPGKGAVGADAVTVSRIFDWFAGDFGGTGGVLAFVGRYREGAHPTRLDGYFEYDWGLNGVE
ncbi:MAG: DUF547 domain-containing protein [Nitrospirota bacterium]|nr:DUF547 domain-containing protein [Nitrospirota bacterium]